MYRRAMQKCRRKDGLAERRRFRMTKEGGLAGRAERASTDSQKLWPCRATGTEKGGRPARCCPLLATSCRPLASAPPPAGGGKGEEGEVGGFSTSLPGIGVMGSTQQYTTTTTTTTTTKTEQQCSESFSSSENKETGEERTSFPIVTFRQKHQLTSDFACDIYIYIYTYST